MKSFRLGILMGGNSLERKISLKTGNQVLNSFQKKNYNVKKFVIGKSSTPENLWTLLIFFAAISIKSVKLSVSKSPLI